MEIGDVVHLKSGGPTMTVEVITKEAGRPGHQMHWFDNGELKRGIFLAATLKESEDDDDDEMADRCSLGYVGFRATKADVALKRWHRRRRANVIIPFEGLRTELTGEFALAYIHSAWAPNQMRPEM